MEVESSPSEPAKSRWQRFHENAGYKGDFSHLSLSDPFSMKKAGVNWRSEMRAGMVTFLTMVYIIPVNASILANVIGDGPAGPFGPGFVNYKEDLIVATAASCGIACILMGLMSNFPFALAPGMGTNAFFAFSIVLKYNVPWRTALSAIWIAGFVFAALSLLGVRTWMVRCMPSCIRLAMACGIGLFLAFIGLKDMGLIVNDGATFVTLNTPLSDNNPDFQKIWLGVVVLFIMGVLLSRNFPGAILVGILFGTFTCWIDGAVTKFDALNPTAHPAHFCYPMGAIDNLGNRVFNGAAYGTTEKPVGGGCTSASYIVFPLKFAQKAACPNTCGALSFDNMQSSAFGGALLTFLYTDILDNTATFFAVAKIGGFLNPQTLQLPAARANMAYLSDAISTIIGASLGVSTVVTYIESATGVRDGGRTGLTACFSGLFFLMCLPFSPWLSQVPALASGPALVVVVAPATNLCAVFVLADAADGVFMMESVKGIDWASMEDALPAFICMIFMPLTFNIPNGIVAGVGCYLAGQLGLAPFRIWQGTDPWVKFKKMMKDDLTDGLTADELTEIRKVAEDESVRIAKVMEEQSIRDGKALPK